MSTPQLNPVGYRNSSVKEMEGFKNVDFALAHGSGDDNGEFGAPLLRSSSSGSVKLTLGFSFSALPQHGGAARSLHERSSSVSSDLSAAEKRV